MRFSILRLSVWTLVYAILFGLIRWGSEEALEAPGWLWPVGIAVVTCFVVYDAITGFSTSNEPSWIQRTLIAVSYYSTALTFVAITYFVIVVVSDGLMWDLIRHWFLWHKDKQGLDGLGAFLLAYIWVCIGGGSLFALLVALPARRYYPLTKKLILWNLPIVALASYLIVIYLLQTLLYRFELWGQ